MPRRLRHDIRPSDLDGFIIPPADIAYIRLHSSCLDTSVPFYLIRSTVQFVQLINIHPLPCMSLPAIEETLHHSSPLFYYQSSKRHGLPPEPFPKRPAITRTTTLRMPGCTHVGHTHPPPYDNDSVKPRPRLEGYSIFLHSSDEHHHPATLLACPGLAFSSRSTIISISPYASCPPSPQLIHSTALTTINNFPPP